MTSITEKDPAAWADVIEERKRQMSAEGYTLDHDDEHVERELAIVAGCYVMHYVERAWTLESKAQAGKYPNGQFPEDWPRNWDEKFWKPIDPRRDLVRAAALIIAEIERLDREA